MIKEKRNKTEEVLSRALLAKSPEEAMKIFRDAGMFTSIQCHGYTTNNANNIDNNANNIDGSVLDEKKQKKWWKFWR